MSSRDDEAVVIAAFLLMLHAATCRVVVPLPSAAATLQRGTVVLCALLALCALVTERMRTAWCLLLLPVQILCLLIVEDLTIKWASRMLAGGFGLRPGALGCLSLFSAHSPLEHASVLDLGAGSAGAAAAVLVVRPAGALGVAAWLTLRHAEAALAACGRETERELRWATRVELAVAALQSHGHPSVALMLAAVPYVTFAATLEQRYRALHYVLLVHAMWVVIERNTLPSARALAATCTVLCLANNCSRDMLPATW